MKILFPLLLLLSFARSDESPEQWRQKADAYVDDGHYRKAIEIYERILPPSASWENRQLARILNNLGFCHFKLQQYGKACEYYIQALNWDDQYALCLNNLAAALMKQDKYIQTLPFLERALALDPRAVKVVFNLFVVHARLRHEEEATRYLKLALEIDEAYTTRRFKNRNFSDQQIQSILRKIRRK